MTKDELYDKLLSIQFECKTVGPARYIEKLTDDPEEKVKCQREPGHDGLHLHETGQCLYLWDDDKHARVIPIRDYVEKLNHDKAAPGRTEP